MKLRTLALALLIVLCGCAAQQHPAIPPTVPPITEPVIETEPAGCYDAESELEKATLGALKSYPLSRKDAISIVPMGEDMLLFSGADVTTLTKFSGETLYISDDATLNCSIYPTDPAVQVCEMGITYYDERQNALIFLDTNLKEVKRVSLPDTITGTPALNRDRQKLYYCTADALRCIDLESGLDRLLKEMYFSMQTVTALHCDDSIIVCDVEDIRGYESQIYISASNGQLLYETLGDVSLWTEKDFYLALHQDGTYQEILLGDAEQGPTLLTPHTYGSTVFPVLERGGAVLVSEDSASDTVQLDYYDLRSGKRTSRIHLSGLEQIRGVYADAQAVWFLRYNATYGCETLYRWDLEKSATGDGSVCLSTRYTAEKPDSAGLAACMATADALSEKHGVEILLWTDATTFQPWDYTLVPEYQVPVIQKELEELDAFLSMYPQGFLEKVADRTASGRIRICLVRSILGNADTGSLNEAMGLQYWDDHADVYLTLATKDLFTQTACHEMFHIIESRVLSTCRAYDDWNKLNPKGFTYDFDYIANLSRNDQQWIEGQTRAFIDMYSMSYPKEDRARIMEYAMMPGNEDCFTSEPMQQKLRQLCLGIREALELEKVTSAFLWEQYLNEPIHP